MVKRIMVAVVCIPLLAAAVYGVSPVYPVILPILVAGLSMIAVHEVLWSTGFLKHPRISGYSIVLAGLVPFWVYYSGKLMPALAGMILFQVTGGAVARTLKPRLAPFAKLTLLLIITANATGCASFLRNMTPTLLMVTVVVFFLCLLGFFLGYWAGRLLKLDFPTIQTVALNSGMRNVSAGAVLAMEFFPPDVLFPVAFSPIFLQATTAFIVKALRATGPGRADEAEYRRAQAEQTREGT